MAGDQGHLGDRRVLRASEIGEYVFCHRAWWLHRFQDIESANVEQMQAGTARHTAHGRAVRRAEVMRRAAFALFVLAFLFAALFVLAVR
jgi:hypothetical protein